MNLTTTIITGIALSVFAVALGVRATASRPAPATDGWRDLLPTIESLEAAPVPEVDHRDIEDTYERAVTKVERAKTEATEALDDMRHANEQLGAAGPEDDLERSHWQRSYRAANLRFAEASHARRQGLREIDRVRTHLREICVNVEPAAP